MRSSKIALQAFAVLGLSLGVVFLAAHYIPLDMDEFVPYHTLACLEYPLNQLNVFRESCSGYDLALWGKTFLPLRTYGYEGSLPSLLYYPLFKIWPSPYSARWIGILILALQGLILGKLFKMRSLYCFLGLLLFMPYGFSHIVDFGPSSYQTVSMLLLYAISIRCARRLEENRSIFFYCVGAGILIFICLWIQIVFFLILPGLLLSMCFWPVFSLIKMSKAGLKKKVVLRFFWGATTMGLAAALPAWWLFNALTRTGTTYAHEYPPSQLFLSLSQAWNHAHYLWYFFHNPLRSTHIIFLARNDVSVEGILFHVIVPAVLALGIWRSRKDVSQVFAICVPLACFFIAFGVLSSCSWVGGMHHVILTLPFLILALAACIRAITNSKIYLAVILCSFVALNLSLFGQLKTLPYNQRHHDFSQIKLNGFLNGYSDKYVFICVDWGMYYIKSLYGNRDQCVLYIEPLNKTEQIAQVKGILKKLGRKAMFISVAPTASDWKLIVKEFPGMQRLNTGFETGRWQVWYEPQGAQIRKD